MSGALLLAVPKLTFALKTIAAAWILWMAWGLWQSSRRSAEAAGRPMAFHEAVLFQWINPKIWAVALAAVTGYGGGLTPLGEAARLALAFSGTNLFVCLFWTGAGAALTYLLRTPRAWRVFSRIMALALAAFSIMVFV